MDVGTGWPQGPGPQLLRVRDSDSDYVFYIHRVLSRVSFQVSTDTPSRTRVFREYIRTRMKAKNVMGLGLPMLKAPLDAATLITCQHKLT
jgi:hypothetical protein